MIVSLNWDDFLHSIETFPDAEKLVFDESLLLAKQLIANIMADDISLDEVFNADDTVFHSAYELISDEPSVNVRLMQEQLQDQLNDEGTGGSLRSLLQKLARIQGTFCVKEGEFI